MAPKLDALFIRGTLDCLQQQREAFVDWGYWVFAVAGLVVVMGLVLWQFKR